MPPRLVAGPGGPSASKMLKKERIIQVYQPSIHGANHALERADVGVLGTGIQALSRMNDRDTQKAAAEDLLSIVLNMDQEGLLIIISCLCSTGSEHKVFARKECARAIGVIASEACPLREQALQQPHLGKMLGQLRRSLQDPDSGVREASSEALALVAQGLAQVEANGAQGSLNNPVVKLIFDCLAEQKKELNAAACAALGLAAPFLGTLDASLARELVRKLNSPSFQAPAALLAALARSDPATAEPIGLMKAGRLEWERSGPAAFVPLLSALVGQPASPPMGGNPTGTAGSGVGGALSRPDWPVRLAAADMLRATAALLGPLMEHDGCWTRGDAKSITGRAIRALESCKFDKVRDVRDVARNALSVMEELHAYGSAGGTLQGWPEHIARKLYGPDLQPPVATSTFVVPSFVLGAAAAPGPPLSGRKSPVRRSAGSPARRPRSAQPQGPLRASASPPRSSARSPTPAERRSSPMLARGGSVSERFRAAHRDVDVVSVHFLGGVASEPGPGPANEEGPDGAVESQPLTELTAESALARAAGHHDDTLPDAAPGSRRVSRQPSKASDSGRAADRGFALEPRVPSQPSRGLIDAPPATDALLRNLAQDDDDAVAVLDSHGPPTFSAHGIAELPSAAELTAWAAAVTHTQPPELPSCASAASSTVSAPDGAAPPSVPSAFASKPSVSIPVEEWVAAQQRLRSLEEQQRQLLVAFTSMTETNKQTIAGLQAKVRSLEAALETAQSQVTAQQPPPQQQLQQQQAGVGDLPLAEGEMTWATRTIRPGSPIIPLLVSSGTTADGAGATAAPAPATAAVPAASAGSAATDVRQAYREVLAAGRLSDMHLLRLMQRTGPIWADLGPELSSQLLAAFTASLQQARADGPLLSRVMPWLWRLADEENIVFEAPFEMRSPLLGALRTAQAAVTDPLLYDRVGLLVSTLRTHWSLPETQSAAAGQRAHLPPQPQPPQPQLQNQLPPQPQPHHQPSPAIPSPQSGSGGAPQELSFGAGLARAIAGMALGGAAYGGNGSVAESSKPTTTAAPALTPTEAQSPGMEAPGLPAATPRLSVLRSSQTGQQESGSQKKAQGSLRGGSRSKRHRDVDKVKELEAIAAAKTEQFAALLRRNSELKFRSKILSDAVMLRDYQLRIVKYGGGSPSPWPIPALPDGAFLCPKPKLPNHPPPSVRAMGRLQLIASWKAFVQEAGSLLLALEMNPADEAAAHQIKKLAAKIGSLCRRISVLAPDTMIAVSQTHLETDTLMAPDPGFWAQVVQALRLTEEQLREMCAVYELFSGIMGRILAERRAIQAKLSAGLQTDPRSMAVEMHVPPEGEVLPVLERSLRKESAAHLLVRSFLFGRTLSIVQFCRAALHSYPFFPNATGLAAAAAGVRI
ncbi:hypothetical protein VOLCADRAFT_86913 [Volvox carteri f. nagariensis]|uniref:TOG domain-containing protein n=1 Tax=Volvox carteri f. nagariensis TaxID=3068 RepID=D8TKP4_VOLCA|nr:uncharacterized protein VOLCADRAFT_86913 [Volvox carteri f. nagariensis]EFJ51921.1 hypothetical protein VOLCADRAFT_86913 [Volvox carteri f. nagariensis]|eukprot:XP_002946695.1 hypothetical protein VOLCADRAFT_86913 [Volvox carteri f. nagariensis]